MPRVAGEKILPAQLERRVYERLRGEIVSGDLGPGEQLVEARIAEELGVSKTPVREALIRLQRDGLVAIEPYRGARVLEPSRDDVREILELRLALESWTVHDLALLRPTRALAALEASIGRSRAALAAGERSRLAEELSAFSDILAGACSNRRMAKILGDLRGVLRLIGTASLDAPGRAERSIAEHEAILAAIRAGEPERAAQATAAHIHSAERDSLGPADGR